MTITDLDGKTIKVTNLKEAIDQVKCYTTFSGKDSRNNKYWEHTLAELLKLDEPKPIEVETVVGGKELPFHVIEARKIFKDNGNKGFIKNDRHSPLYGIHSCAKSPRIILSVEHLKVGESTINSNNTKITRVY